MTEEEERKILSSFVTTANQYAIKQKTKIASTPKDFVGFELPADYMSGNAAGPTTIRAATKKALLSSL